MKAFDPNNYINTEGAITAAEILQQPSVYRKIIDVLKSQSIEINRFMDNIMSIPNIRILFLGAGSSAFCGEMLTAAAAELGIRSEAPHTTDIVTSPAAVLHSEAPTLIISFARSGNSPESIGAVEYARHSIKELYEVCITCAAHGQLAEITKNDGKSLKIILPDESCDRGFAMTSSLTGMAVAAYGLLHYRNLDKWAADVSILADTLEQRFQVLVEKAQEISKLEFNRLAILGCGTLKGAAREAAVKMSELSAGNVSVVYDTSAGFRHGPKSMVKPGTLSMHYISPDMHTCMYDIDLLNEMMKEKQGNTIIALTSGEATNISADYCVNLGDEKYSDGQTLYAAVKYTVFAQLLAFFTSQKLGITTDDPCPTGEINRVVQGVTIYPLI